MQFRTDPFLLIFVPEASQITVWLRIDLKLKPAFFFLDMKPDILGKIMKFPREPAGIRFFHIINPHQKNIVSRCIPITQIRIPQNSLKSLSIIHKIANLPDCLLADDMLHTAGIFPSGFTSHTDKLQKLSKSLMPIPTLRPRQ